MEDRYEAIKRKVDAFDLDSTAAERVLFFECYVNNLIPDRRLVFLGSPNDFNSAGFIFCDVFGGHMRMNKNSLRYLQSFEIGFTDGKDVNVGGPRIEIGTCSPL